MTRLGTEAIEHLSAKASLEAWRISEELNSDRPDDLLENIDGLNGCADLARWVLGGGVGDLSDRGKITLAVIWAEDTEDLERTIEECEDEQSREMDQARVAWAETAMDLAGVNDAIADGLLEKYYPEAVA